MSSRGAKVANLQSTIRWESQTVTVEGDKISKQSSNCNAYASVFGIANTNKTNKGHQDQNKTLTISESKKRSSDLVE